MQMFLLLLSKFIQTKITLNATQVNKLNLMSVVKGY